MTDSFKAGTKVWYQDWSGTEHAGIIVGRPGTKNGEVILDVDTANDGLHWGYIDQFRLRDPKEG